MVYRTCFTETEKDNTPELCFSCKNFGYCYFPIPVKDFVECSYYEPKINRRKIMSVKTFEDLSKHLGHKVVCVGYGEVNEVTKDQKHARILGYDNIVIECETCGEILFSYDRLPFQDSKEEF